MWAGVNVSTWKGSGRLLKCEWTCVGVEVIARAHVIISVIVCKGGCEHECTYAQE